MSFLGSLIAGGGTGLIGSIVTNVTDYFEQKRKNKHEKEMRQLDLQEMDKEYEYKERIVERKTEAQETEASYRAQEESYEHDSRSYSAGVKVKSPWLKALLVVADFIRALVRPALTAYLIYLVWDTRQEVQMIIDQTGVQNLSISEALTIYSTIVDLILYLASVCVTWWFGTRPRKSKKQD